MPATGWKRVQSDGNSSSHKPIIQSPIHKSTKSPTSSVENLPWTRISVNRSNEYFSPTRRSSRKLDASLHKLTQMLSMHNMSPGGCIKTPQLMNPEEVNNYFGFIHAELDKDRISNFRMGLMTFNGNTIIVAGMASPPRKKGDTLAHVLSSLGFRHVFSVAANKRAYKDTREVFFKQHIAYIQYSIEDFQVPEDEVVNALVNFATDRSRLCQNFVVHCGEGWGRTGVSLTILFANTDEFKTMVLHYNTTEGRDWLLDTTDGCILGKHASVGNGCERSDTSGELFKCICTNILRLTLGQVRYFETNAGSNTRSNTGGMSVENNKQLKWLDAYVKAKTTNILDMYETLLTTVSLRAAA